LREPLNATAVERKRKGNGGGHLLFQPSSPKPARSSSSHHSYAADWEKKDCPILLASPKTRFLCLLPEQQWLYQSAPASVLQKTHNGHFKCCLKPGVKTIITFGQGTRARAPSARLQRKLAEYQELCPTRSIEHFTSAHCAGPPDEQGV